MSHRASQKISSTASILFSVMLPSLAAAQLEEVVVTAQKRQESLQDVGISVTAFSAKQLEELNIGNTTAITQQVPGLQVSAFSPVLTVFNLRGVSQNNFQDNLEAPVAVYMDGVYVASMNAINSQLFDVDRIEVLRGPQGTLFGRNATGGLIHFISRKATDTSFNGYVEAGVAKFSTYSLEAALGGSLSDRMRGRIAARGETSDGYLKPGVTNGQQAQGRTSQGANGYAVRGTLQFDVTDAVLLDLTGSYSADRDVPTGEYTFAAIGFDPTTGLGRFTNAVDPANPDAGPTNFSRRAVTGDPWRHSGNDDPRLDRTVRSGTAQVTAKLGEGIELVSITNAMSMDKKYNEDANTLVAPFFPYNTRTSYEQWSQELRLSGALDRFRWQVGGYYLDMTWDTFQYVAGSFILSGVTGSLTDTQNMSTFGKVDSRNWSAFGQAEYDLTDELTLIAGARWSHDDKDLDLRRVYADVPAGIPPTETFNIHDVPIPGVDRIDYGDYAARVQLNWKPIADHLFYLAFNRGIKGGNWSLDPLGSVANEDLKHGPEKLLAYEIGWKADLFGGLARLNTAAFYYDYRDYQAFSMLAVTPQVTNSDAKAHGGELELTLAPTEGLLFSLGAAFIDSEVDAVPNQFGGVVRDAELPNAPAVSLNWLGRYEWPALAGSIGVQVDGRWNDDQYLEGTNAQVSHEPSYAVWNASVSYRTADEKIRLAAYVKNFTNEAYRSYDLDLGLLGVMQEMYAPPRQYGASVTYRW
ncbi:MAG TPA: TonB-dependent receptor [Steroidobacteraceae bacterium]|nr:TonB-dependent receptor [Steroidobacteraceae bacterium]